MWSIGEYADFINVSDIHTNNGDIPLEHLNITDDCVIDMCEKIMSLNLITIITKQYTISALMKLSVRFPSSANRVKKIIDGYGCHMHTELQQRAVEFSALFTKHANLRPSLLERMPPMKSASEKKENVQNGQVNEEEMNGDLDREIISTNAYTSKSESSALLDLLGDLSPVSGNTEDTIEKGPPNNVLPDNVLDLLGGIDLSPSPITASIPSFIETNSITSGTTNTLLNNFNLLEGSNPSTLINTSQKIPSLTAFEKNGLKLIFDFERPFNEPTTLVVSLSATNSTAVTMTDFLFQAAVPKVIEN